MYDEYKGHVTLPMLGSSVTISYRVLWGAQPYIMDAYIKNTLDDWKTAPVSAMPDGVRVRIYDAIIADVREQEQARMREGVTL